MATPAENDYIISQGDSLPVMRVTLPRNNADELIDLTGCSVTFLGRPVGSSINPPPIVRLIDSYQVVGTGEDAAVVVSVKLTSDDTKKISVKSGETYQEMQGELEIVDTDDEVLTVPTDG
jgi:hypothetical protein